MQANGFTLTYPTRLANIQIMDKSLKYQTGFGNELASEAIENALPDGMNSPQRPPLGLYAEQLSGTAFTALPHENQRSWLYRIEPSVKHSRLEPVKQSNFLSACPSSGIAEPNQLRWDPFPYPKYESDFIDSIFTLAVNGSVLSQTGSAIHIYATNKSMEARSFLNADGHLLIVPQEGSMIAMTEMGRLKVQPGEILVIPRGIKFSMKLLDKQARGYICENYGAHFRLPYRGAIGANGLANPRDFLYPEAAYEDSSETYHLTKKFAGQLFNAEQPSSPFNVVAWHGNYAPYKYDLAKFNTIGTVSFDHPDPSIFTVLTSPTTAPGVANLDFVIFPPRWMVGENTFRPPWYHRNIMSEFMGLIHGAYDAKPGKGFAPGGSSLHSCMSAHGPDSEAFTNATEAELNPEKIDNTLAFMFESCFVYLPTPIATEHPTLQKDYIECWQELKSHFTP